MIDDFLAKHEEFTTEAADGIKRGNRANEKFSDKLSEFLTDQKTNIQEVIERF
jgi:hypothetical protein